MAAGGEWGRLRLLAAVAAVAGLPVSCATSDTAPPGPPSRNEAATTVAVDMLARITPLEVRVHGCRLTDDLATGFAIAGGRVVTAAHTLRGSKTRLVDGRNAQVIALDLRTDVAILQVSGVVDDQAWPGFADAELDDVVAMHVLRNGTATRLTGSVVRTPLIQFEEPADQTVYDRDGLFIDGDEIIKGDSGAPVVDADGHVVGMVFATGRTRARAYAVSSAEIEALIPPDGAAPVSTGKC